MSPLGDLTSSTQAQIVALYVQAMGATSPQAPSFLQRIDVADVRREVLDGLFERLRCAGVRYRIEGRFLVMGGER